jgi:hypothetical protein
MKALLPALNSPTKALLFEARRELQAALAPGGHQP